jgi:hypothetical protein
MITITTTPSLAQALAPRTTTTTTTTHLVDDHVGVLSQGRVGP